MAEVSLSSNSGRPCLGQVEGNAAEPDENGAQPQRPVAAAEGDHDEPDHVEHDACGSGDHSARASLTQNIATVQLNPCQATIVMLCNFCFACIVAADAHP